MTEISNESILRKTIERIHPVNPDLLDRAVEQQRHLTKPEGSLGRLEEVSNRCFGGH